MYKHTDLAWAAGFFDGEGYIGTSARGPWIKIQVTIAQIDRVVLDRFMAIMGHGSVTGPRSVTNRPKQKPIYTYYAYGFEQCQHMTCLLWQYLSPIKRRQCVQALQAFVAYRAGRRKYERKYPEKLA